MDSKRGLGRTLLFTVGTSEDPDHAIPKDISDARIILLQKSKVKNGESESANCKTSRLGFIILGSGSANSILKLVDQDPPITILKLHDSGSTDSILKLVDQDLPITILKLHDPDRRIQF